MDDSITILGRQPALGAAELESLYGADAVEVISPGAVRLHVAPCSIDFKRLGGSIKLCKLLTVLETTNWKDVERFLIDAAPDHASRMTEGKMHLGLSIYDFELPLKQILASGLKIKKAIQRTGRSVRLAPNTHHDLNAAQVIHNKLLGDHGWELVFVRSGSTTIVAQTIAVQDIDSYSRRDYGRPKRDAKVGMLPPKLAQTLINLAVGPNEFEQIKDTLSSDVCLSEAEEARMHSARQAVRLLDPFCGTGVVLQEAALMGYNTYGTDLEQRMIDYTKTNLAWLMDTYPRANPSHMLANGDATSYAWEAPIDMVASETYLGRPFTTFPTPEVLAQTVADCNLIIKKFLQNIYTQIKPNTRLCLAIPAWQVKPGSFRFLPLVDQINELGYNQVRFERLRNSDLIYYRPDQIVARQLLVITRN